VTRKWRHLTGSHLEVAVEGQKLAYTVRITSYKAAARMWWDTRHEITSHDLKCPEVTSFDRKSPGSCCRRPKTRVYCAFHFLQYCFSQEEVVTWQDTSRDLRWPEVTRNWRHMTGSLLEVAVEGENSRILCVSFPARLYLAGGGSHVTGNDVT